MSASESKDPYGMDDLALASRPREQAPTAAVSDERKANSAFKSELLVANS